MKLRPSSRTLVTMERSVTGTLSGTSACTRINIQSYKAWSNMDTLASMNVPKLGTCWTGSRLMSWTLPRDRYGPHLPYRPTSMTASRCSRISLTIRRLPPRGPPLLLPLGPKGNLMILTKMTLNPTCQWMTVTTWARNTPSCPRPRNLASSLSAKGVVTSRVTWAKTSQIIWVTRSSPGQHRSPQMTREQQHALSRHCQGSLPKVNRKTMTQ